MLSPAWIPARAAGFPGFTAAATGSGVGVPERRTHAARISIKASFAQLGETARKMRRYGELVKFLIARLFFNDGLVTVFSFGGIYAENVFHMGFSRVIVLGIVINVTAGRDIFKWVKVQAGSENILDHTDPVKLPNLSGRTFFKQAPMHHFAFVISSTPRSAR